MLTHKTDTSYLHFLFLINTVLWVTELFLCLMDIEGMRNFVRDTEENFTRLFYLCNLSVRGLILRVDESLDFIFGQNELLVVLHSKTEIKI